MIKAYTAAIIKEDDKFLFLDHKKIGGLVFPGGKIEDNEVVQSNVVRECKEELGIGLL